MKYFYTTDKGRIRSHNEDSVTIIKNNTNELLMAVADGMGGHKAGEVASNIAIKYLEDSFLSRDSIGTKEEAIEYLKDIVNKINNSVFKYAKDFPESKGLGSTLVLSIKTNDYILIGNIGDSSAFVLKNEKLHKITHDHTLVNLLVSTGELTEEEALNHPRKNILMRAIGANDPLEIDIFDVVDQNITGVLLCSDGLTNLISKDQIEKVLNNDESIEEQVLRLIRKCNNRGGTDNISIAYLSLKEGE